VPVHISTPAVVPGVGEKVIGELVGRVNTGSEGVSVARMTSPPGWEEPPQTPAFDEVTLVLEGAVVVEHTAGTITARAGEAVLARAGERVLLDAGGGGVRGDLRPGLQPGLCASQRLETRLIGLEISRCAGRATAVRSGK
jgi:quercetin dioxygenase-like cupin family protein